MKAEKTELEKETIQKNREGFMLLLNLLTACISDELRLVESRVNPPEVKNLLTSKNIASKITKASSPTGNQTSIDRVTTSWDLSNFSTDEVRFNLVKIDEYTIDNMVSYDSTGYSPCNKDHYDLGYCHTYTIGTNFYKTSLTIDFDVSQQSENASCRLHIAKDAPITDTETDWSAYNSEGYTYNQFISDDPYITCVGDFDFVEAATLMTQALYAIPN